LDSTSEGKTEKRREWGKKEGREWEGGSERAKRKGKGEGRRERRRRKGKGRERKRNVEFRILAKVLVSIPSIKVTSAKFVAIHTVISHISKAPNLAFDRIITDQVEW